jgi:hypothetical protein
VLASETFSRLIYLTFNSAHLLRVIYWLKLPECAVLLDIYSKSDRDDVEVNIIQDIITEFDKQIDDETE